MGWTSPAGWASPDVVPSIEGPCRRVDCECIRCRIPLSFMYLRAKTDRLGRLGRTGKVRQPGGSRRVRGIGHGQSSADLAVRTCRASKVEDTKSRLVDQPFFACDFSGTERQGSCQPHSPDFRRDQTSAWSVLPNLEIVALGLEEIGRRAVAPVAVEVRKRGRESRDRDAALGGRVCHINRGTAHRCESRCATLSALVLEGGNAYPGCATRPRAEFWNRFAVRARVHRRDGEWRPRRVRADREGRPERNKVYSPVPHMQCPMPRTFRDTTLARTYTHWLWNTPGMSTRS